MTTRRGGSTVLLSDRESGHALAARLAARVVEPSCVTSVAELVRHRPLSSVAVLVVHCRPLPKGIVLAILGRISVEYPTMQKVVLLEAPPPLRIAEYLTSCGADILLTGDPDGDIERLASVIESLHERTRWIAA